MLGKTFKGLTDEMLAWQTERLLELETHRDGASRSTCDPELVVEIAFDGIQTSSRYPGGVALRFARVIRYRPDKRAGRGRHDRDRADAARGRPRLTSADRLARGLTRRHGQHPGIISTEPARCTRVTRSPRWMWARATVTTGKSELSTAVIASSCSVVETE